jgi:hypothetical protein
VRGYQARWTGNGRADISFYFVPDDGSEPQLFELSGTAPMAELGEYARGYVQDGKFDIKVSPDTMSDAERSFQRLNSMDLPSRKKMFAGGNDIYSDAGWAWTPDYCLVKVAPGLDQNRDFRQRSVPQPTSTGPVVIDGEEDLDVVGESFYQDNLWQLVGAQPGDHYRRVEITAVLVPEYDNPHDPNAVGVLIDGLKVGHLSRSDAREYRPGLLALQERHRAPIALPGDIVGGGIREDGPGKLGVFLRHDPADFGL